MTSLDSANRQRRLQPAALTDVSTEVRQQAGSEDKLPIHSTISDTEKSKNPCLQPENCAERVMDTIPLVMRFIRSHLQEEEGSMPSVPQIRVLACLTKTPGASLSDVARYINVTKATASNMIGRMVEKGLVERLDHPSERRCVVLNATSAGREIYLTARDHAQDAVAEVLSELSAEQKAKIAEGLELLREAFLK